MTVSEHWMKHRDTVSAAFWAVLGAVVVATLLASGYVAIHVESLTATTAQLGKANHTLVSELQAIQTKSTEQTKAEVQLRADVSRLAVVAHDQALLLTGYHSANTQFFEYIREVLVYSADVQNATTAKARDIALVGLDHVELALAKFRFPEDQGP